MARKQAEPGKMTRVSEGIYRRNGMLVVRVWNPHKGRNGGRDDYPVPIGDDYALALDQAKDLKREKDKERLLRERMGGESLTVREWAQDKWLQAFPRPKESSNDHNRERVKGFVERFGTLKLQSLLRPERRVEIREWAVENVPRVPATKAMLNDAVRLKLLAENPLGDFRVPKREGRENIRVITDAEIARLVEIAESVHGDYGRLVYGPLIEFEAWTGLRPGEVYGLGPDDVDFSEGVIHVEWQFHMKLNRPERTKTDSPRMVVLLPKAEAALRRLRWPDTPGPLFRSVRDKQMSARTHFYYWDAVRNAWALELPGSHWLSRRIAERGKAGNLDFYELRHRFASELAAKGATGREIALQLGHKDGGRLAERVYVHTDARRANERLRELFREAS